MNPSRLAPWQLRRVTEYMQANIHRPLHTAEMAAISRLSNSHFGRAFKGSTGLSPYRRHLKLRVEHACVLLAETDLSLAEVAYSTGFSDQSHFTRIFDKMVGISPGTWRRAQTSHPLARKMSEIPADAIRNLITALYIRVRRDPVLAPTFLAFVGATDDDWNAFIASIIQSCVWDTADGRETTSIDYPRLDGELYGRWRELYASTCQDLFEPEMATALQDLIPGASQPTPIIADAVSPPE